MVAQTSSGADVKGSLTIINGKTVGEHNMRGLTAISLALMTRLCAGHPERTAWIATSDSWQESDCGKFLVAYADLMPVLQNELDVLLTVEDLRLALSDTKKGK